MICFRNCLRRPFLRTRLAGSGRSTSTWPHAPVASAMRSASATRSARKRCSWCGWPEARPVSLRFSEELTDFIAYKENLEYKGHRRVLETCSVELSQTEPDSNREVELARIYLEFARANRSTWLRERTGRLLELARTIRPELAEATRLTAILKKLPR